MPLSNHILWLSLLAAQTRKCLPFVPEATLVHGIKPVKTAASMVLWCGHLQIWILQLMEVLWFSRSHQWQMAALKCHAHTLLQMCLPYVIKCGQGLEPWIHRAWEVKDNSFMVCLIPHTEGLQFLVPHWFSGFAITQLVVMAQPWEYSEPVHMSQFTWGSYATCHLLRGH